MIIMKRDLVVCIIIGTIFLILEVIPKWKTILLSRTNVKSQVTSLFGVNKYNVIETMVSQSPCSVNKFDIVEKMLTKQSNPRFFIYVCDRGSCGGLADRQKGIVGSYLISMLTNRTFGIIHQKAFDLSDYMEPNMVNWNIKPSTLKHHTSIRFLAVGNRKLKHLLSLRNLNKFFKEDVIYFRSNLDYVSTIRHHSNTSKQLPWLMSMSDCDIYSNILNILFKPSENLIAQKQSLLKEQVDRSKLVCVHIRMGQNPTIPNDQKPRLQINELDLIWKFLQRYNDIHKYKLFIASDSNEVRNIARNKFGKQIIDIQGDTVHVDRLRGQSSRSEFNKVFLEQIILSSCDVLVLTRSGYGVMAAFLRNHSRELYCLINNEVVPCVRELLINIYNIQ